MAAADERLEANIVALLYGPGAASVWSVGELERAVGGDIEVVDALDRLFKAGVVHRCGHFVFVTRAAMRALQLADF